MDLANQLPKFFHRMHLRKTVATMGSADDKKCIDSKICAVCGDSALGNNFNAVTCESCKAFFRRNALKAKMLRCPFKENCEITSITRRFCQKCRLEKCYAVGMKRELIMSEEEKETKRRKVQANKAKFMLLPARSPTMDSTSSQESDCSDRNSKSFSAVEIGVQTDLPCRCSQRTSSPSSYGFSSPPESPQQFDCDQKSGFHTLHTNSNGFARLDPTQQKLLDDLVLASKALEAPVDQIMDWPGGEEFKDAPKNLIDVINLTALAIRRLIKMCKKMSGFKLLCQEDQVSLLKQGCTQMMLLKSVTHFDPAKDSWKIPHTVGNFSQIQVGVLKEARGNIYEAHEQFLRTFDSRATQDMKVMCILTAIALFDPSKQQLLDRPTVIRHQEMYYNLLKKYLESVHPPRDSLEIYQHLIVKMVELRHINEDHVKVYLDVNPSQVEPILIEIFDLKPH